MIRSIPILKNSLLFVFLLMVGLCSLSQSNRNSGLAMEEGIIVFEGEGNVFDIYFIKTTTHNLNGLLKVKDTIHAISIQPLFDGCVPMASGKFKESLESIKTFDSLSFSIIQENHRGQSYEDSTNLYYKHGQIKYRKSRLNDYPYNTPYPNVQYKKIHYHEGIRVIAIKSRIPIENFSTKAAVKNIVKRK